MREARRRMMCRAGRTLTVGAGLVLLQLPFPDDLLALQDPQVVPDTTATVEAREAPPPAFQAVQDSAASAQLQALFDRIEELREVRVDVDGGVAALSGRALTPDARDTAMALARGRPGVLYVVDKVEVETSLDARLRPVLQRIASQSIAVVAALPLLLVAAAVFLGFIVLARWAVRWRWLFRRFEGTPLVADILHRALGAALWIVGLILALEILDATSLVGAVLGAAGVAGIAFGFAFRNIAENLLAGMLLGFRRPFDPDDEVSIGGNTGRVVRLTHSDTVLMTAAGNHLRLPNASVFNGVVENFSRNPLRRFTLRLTVPRDAAVPKARAVILNGLGRCPGVLEDPPAQVLVTEVGDAHLAFEVYGWVDQRHAAFTSTRGLAYQRAKEALEAAGIPGPFTEHTIYMGPEDSPGSATYRAPGADVSTAEVEESESPESVLDRQVAADRATSDDADLLGGR